MKYSEQNLQDLLDQIIKIAKLAGAGIKQHFDSFNKHTDLEIKPDNSPVTKADISANNIIEQELEKIFLDNTIFKLPILSEESYLEINPEYRLEWEDYWLVDPLDGTKEFINHSPEFCINIALVHDKHPIIGVIYAPMFDITYAGYNYKKYIKAYKIINNNKIILNRLNKNKNLTITTSKDYNKIKSNNTTKLNKLLTRLEQNNINYKIVKSGSAIKFGLVADNTADIYPRFGFTSEWDTAAGDCIIHALGGRVCDLSGRQLLYNNKQSLINPEFYVVMNDHYNWQELLNHL